MPQRNGSQVGIPITLELAYDHAPNFIANISAIAPKTKEDKYRYVMSLLLKI